MSVPSRVLITGANGQLGQALQTVFPTALGLGREQWDVTAPSPPSQLPPLSAVLHAAAWTDVDGAETDEPSAERANVAGTRNVVRLGVPVVTYSSDYVFDGSKREPYVESDPTGPLSAYGRTKLAAEREIGAGWIVRTAWLFGANGRNFVRTMLHLAANQDEVSVVDDQIGCPTYVGHLAMATRELMNGPEGTWHLAAQGQCSWAEFAEAIFEERGVNCRVRRIATGELARPAPRPAYSVLRSERAGAPQLPHWRDGLRECLARLADQGL